MDWQDPLVVFNLVEAGWWFCLSLVCGVALRRVDPRLRRTLVIVSMAFAAFGVSDLIECRTGAWWRPWWLFALKAGCVLTLLAGGARIYRLRRSRDLP